MTYRIHDYEMDAHTLATLAMFEKGGDNAERGLSTIGASKAVADYLHTINDAEKAMVIIDLLVLTGTLQSVLLDYQVKELGQNG